MEFMTTTDCIADPCVSVSCKCTICQADSENLRIFKNNLVCESCLDYIKKDIPGELQILSGASFEF